MENARANSVRLRRISVLLPRTARVFVDMAFAPLGLLARARSIPKDASIGVCLGMGLPLFVVKGSGKPCDGLGSRVNTVLQVARGDPGSGIGAGIIDTTHPPSAVRRPRWGRRGAESAPYAGG